MFDFNAKKPLLLDDKDLEYLQLSKAEMSFLEPQFHKYNVNSYKDVLREVCRYAMGNPMFAAKIFLNVDLMPFQGYLDSVLLDKNFVVLVATRGFGKSFMLAVYALLRAIFFQGSKIVIVSASFRQSQVVFNYIDTIYKSSPFLKQICGAKDFPKRNTNMCYFDLGLSKIMCVPLGNGDKIRGLRANCVDGNTLIETTKGLIRIKDSARYMNDPEFKVFTGKNKNCYQPDYFIKTKPIDGYKIIFEQGYELKCSYIHKIFTTDGVKTINELKIGDSVEFVNNYVFPEKNIKYKSIELNNNIAWIFGVLLAEESINDPYCLSMTSTDIDYRDRFADALNKLNLNSKTCIYEKDGYVDKRGWKCKPSWMVQVSHKKTRDIFKEMGLERKKAREKTIPWSILRSPRDVIISFLSGLFEGDGSCFLYKDKKRDNCLGIAYYTGSKRLAEDLSILMKKFNITASIGERKSKISDKIQYHLRFYGKNSIKIYNLLKIKRWEEKYNACCKDIKFTKDKNILKIKKIEKLPEKQVFYDYTIPEDHSFIGSSMKQHNCILVDEFGSVPEQIFQVVVRGFSVVSLDPVSKVKEAYRKLKLEKDGVEIEEDKNPSDNNQIVLTGTASYEFNHFFEWKEKYEKIISCGNDRKKLLDVFGKEMSPKELDSLNPNKFAVITVPYTSLPPGYMDEGIISESKATMTKANFEMEFMGKFYKDSDGFFPASLLIANSKYKPFFPKIKSRGSKKYIMGVDPARQSDHFAITIIEVGENYNHKVVYCWATNEEKMKNSGEVNEHQTYYGACSRKIRMLMDQFDISLIMMDAGGGGREIANYLQENKFLQEGEQPIWEMDDIDQDTYKGLHILKLIASNANWAAEANHAFKKSLETRELTLPMYDIAGIEKELDSSELAKDLAFEKDFLEKSSYMVDTIENTNEEIEELKKELMKIAVTATATGKEHFDLVKEANVHKAEGKEKDRKDRYSSLVLAHWGIQFVAEPQENETENPCVGGLANEYSMIKDSYEMKAAYSGLPHDPNNILKKNVVIRKTATGGGIMY